MTDNDHKPQPKRQPKRQQAAPYDPALKFAWSEAAGLPIIHKARWDRGYSPEPGRTVLVQDLAELRIHLQQTRPGVPLAEALAEILAAPDFPFAPARLKAEMREAGLLPEEEEQP